MKIKDMFNTRKKKDEFLLHCRPEIIEMLYNGRVLYEKDLPERMNSYENQLLMPLWSDELLLSKFEYCLKNTGNEFYETPSWVLPKHYNDAIKTKFIFILLDRFKNLLEERKQ